MGCAQKGKNPIFPGRKVDWVLLTLLNGTNNTAGNLINFISIIRSSLDVEYTYGICNSYAPNGLKALQVSAV